MLMWEKKKCFLNIPNLEYRASILIWWRYRKFKHVAPRRSVQLCPFWCFLLPAQTNWPGSFPKSKNSNLRCPADSKQGTVLCLTITTFGNWFLKMNDAIIRVQGHDQIIVVQLLVVWTATKKQQHWISESYLLTSCCYNWITFQRKCRLPQKISRCELLELMWRGLGAACHSFGR